MTPKQLLLCAMAAAMPLAAAAQEAHSTRWVNLRAGPARDYWGQYYRNRPWYANQPHWAHRAPPPRTGWHPSGPSPRPIVRPPVAQRPQPR